MFCPPLPRAFPRLHGPLRLVLASLILLACSAPARTSTLTRAAATPLGQPSASDELRASAQAVDDLAGSEYVGQLAASLPTELRGRKALLAERRRMIEAGDAAGVARLNAVLVAEAFQRARAVTARWLDVRDPATGLFPSRIDPPRRVWTYGDAGADLFPFLAVATNWLLPERYGEILATLAAERHLGSPYPRDVSLDDGNPVEQEPEKRQLGAVEYAKDGLLPMVEVLGVDPWLGRLREVADQFVANPAASSRRGPILADSTEINGSALQVLARLAWTTRDPAYLALGNRIASAYLDDALPTTKYLPSHRWDFVEDEPIGPRRFYLGDHGDEIVSGLVEWHRVEVATGAPGWQEHRLALRKLLEALLAKGRAPSGLWYEMIDVPDGKVRDADLTDNWGYLAQAYLNLAAIERVTPIADSEASAERFERAAATALGAAAGIRFYSWQAGEMDGYADALESALYLLHYLDAPDADDWVGQQMGVLYGFQRGARVTDDNIDGNFIRTALLYGRYLTRGARLEPWADGLALGAAPEGACLRLHVEAVDAWSGRLLIDSERHAANLGLPSDYPRLNQWPEWFAVRDGAEYSVLDRSGASRDVSGRELIEGVLLQVGSRGAEDLHLCPR